MNAKFIKYGFAYEDIYPCKSTRASTIILE